MGFCLNMHQLFHFTLTRWQQYTKEELQSTAAHMHTNGDADRQLFPFHPHSEQVSFFPKEA